MKDTIGSISQNYQFTKNVGNIFTGLGIIGQGYSFYSNFNQKFKKCNNKNADAAAKALLETGANTKKFCFFLFWNCVRNAYSYPNCWSCSWRNNWKLCW